MRRDVLVWRCNTGAARVPGKRGRARVLRFGLPGQADISGLACTPRRAGTRLEIECKAPELGPRAAGRMSPAQKLFELDVRKFGGIYLIVHSATECLALLDAELY